MNISALGKSGLKLVTIGLVCASAAEPADIATMATASI
jgi:hypothetical protein